MLRPLAALTLLTAALAGCGEQRMATPPAQPTGTGRLVVLEDRAAQPLYTEGSIGFLTIERTGADGPLIDGRVETSTPGTAAIVFSRHVPAGDYRLVRFERPCDGNCGTLDGPVSRCVATFGVVAGETHRVVVHVQPGAGCEIEA
jgi:hypothetical protein